MPRRRRPFRPFALSVLILAAIPVLAATPAKAMGGPVPAEDYPPATQLQFFPNWTNRQFDCNFGMLCDQDQNTPVLHGWTEDQMQRLGGWAMWGEWHHDIMGFELYSSRYGPGQAPFSMTWNQFAAHDERLAIEALQQGRNATSVPNVVPCNFKGSAFAEYVDKPGWHVFFLSVWWGSSNEIEAAALYPPAKRDEARRYLVTEVQEAVDQALAASTSTYQTNRFARGSLHSFCSAPDLAPAVPVG